jgi:hypothetical protein
MDIFIDELTISDAEMPKNHLFLLDRDLPDHIEPPKPVKPQSTMSVGSNLNSSRGFGKTFGQRGGSTAPPFIPPLKIDTAKNSSFLDDARKAS